MDFSRSSLATLATNLQVKWPIVEILISRISHDVISHCSSMSMAQEIAANNLFKAATNKMVAYTNIVRLLLCPTKASLVAREEVWENLKNYFADFNTRLQFDWTISNTHPTAFLSAWGVWSMIQNLNACRVEIDALEKAPDAVVITCYSEAGQKLRSRFWREMWPPLSYPNYAASYGQNGNNLSSLAAASLALEANSHNIFTYLLQHIATYSGYKCLITGHEGNEADDMISLMIRP